MEVIMAQRKQYGGAFKARVVLEAIRGNKTINEIAGTYEVHPSLVNKWKKEALEGLPRLLSEGRDRQAAQRQDEAAELYRQIGQLTMEVSYLKKKLSLCP
jgi:putative transposase